VILIRKRNNNNFKRVAPFPRRRQRSFGMARLITVSGAILFCFLLAVAAVQMFQHFRLQKELAAAELRLAQYESGIEEITEEIARLHEPGYIEVLARKWLGLVRPGEIVFQLED
jgi:cell division protein FtsB